MAGCSNLDMSKQTGGRFRESLQSFQLLSRVPCSRLAQPEILEVQGRTKDVLQLAEPIRGSEHAKVES